MQLILLTDKHQSIKTLQFPVITSESYKLMSNHLWGGKLSRDWHMDVPHTALTFTSIFNLRIQCDPRGAVGFQGADGGIRPLVAASNLAKTSNRGY